MKELYIWPTYCTYTFCVDLRTKSNYYYLQD